MMKWRVRSCEIVRCGHRRRGRGRRWTLAPITHSRHLAMPSAPGTGKKGCRGVFVKKARYEDEELTSDYEQEQIEEEEAEVELAITCVDDESDGGLQPEDDTLFSNASVLESLSPPSSIPLGKLPTTLSRPNTRATGNPPTTASRPQTLDSGLGKPNHKPIEDAPPTVNLKRPAPESADALKFDIWDCMSEVKKRQVRKAARERRKKNCMFNFSHRCLHMLRRWLLKGLLALLQGPAPRRGDQSP